MKKGLCYLLLCSFLLLLSSRILWSHPNATEQELNKGLIHAVILFLESNEKTIGMANKIKSSTIADTNFNFINSNVRDTLNNELELGITFNMPTGKPFEARPVQQYTNSNNKTTNPSWNKYNENQEVAGKLVKLLNEFANSRQYDLKAPLANFTNFYRQKLASSYGIPSDNINQNEFWKDTTPPAGGTTPPKPIPWHFWLYLPLCLFTGLGLGFLTHKLFNNRKVNPTPTDKLNNDYEALKIKYDDLEKNYKELKIKYDNLERNYNGLKEKHENNQTQDPPPIGISESSKTIYAYLYEKDFLYEQETRNEWSLFQIELENPDSKKGTLQLVDGLDESNISMMIKRYFDYNGIWHYKALPTEGQKRITVANPGRVYKDSSGYWKIEDGRKMEISFA